MRMKNLTLYFACSLVLNIIFFNRTSNAEDFRIADLLKPIFSESSSTNSLNIRNLFHNPKIKFKSKSIKELLAATVDHKKCLESFNRELCNGLRLSDQTDLKPNFRRLLNILVYDKGGRIVSRRIGTQYMNRNGHVFSQVNDSYYQDLVGKILNGEIAKCRLQDSPEQLAVFVITGSVSHNRNHGDNMSPIGRCIPLIVSSSHSTGR